MSDVHGHYEPMIAAIKASGFNPKIDQLVIGGDMINKGPDSAKVLMQCRRLEITYPLNIRVLVGNHEQGMTDYLEDENPGNTKKDIFYSMGGKQTEDSINQLFGQYKLEDKAQKDFDALINWVSKLPITYEDDEFVYTHSGIDTSYPTFDQPSDVAWYNAGRLNNLDKANQIELSKHLNNRILVRGHSPVQNVKLQNNIIHCDLGMGTWEDNNSSLGMVDLTNGIVYEAYYMDSGDINTFQQPVKNWDRR